MKLPGVFAFSSLSAASVAVHLPFPAELSLATGRRSTEEERREVHVKATRHRVARINRLRGSTGSFGDIERWISSGGGSRRRRRWWWWRWWCDFLVASFRSIRQHALDRERLLRALSVIFAILGEGGGRQQVALEIEQTSGRRCGGGFRYSRDSLTTPRDSTRHIRQERFGTRGGPEDETEGARSGNNSTSAYQFFLPGGH